MDGDALLGALDSQQAEAVLSPAMPLCVMAGAGSGKTRVLTRRVARRILDGSAKAEHTLVLTFTRKAANELRVRLEGLGVKEQCIVGTFHAIAFAELRRRWLDDGRTFPAVASQPLRILDAALGDLRLDRSVNSRTVMTEISWAKSRRLTHDSYVEEMERQQRRPPVAALQFCRIFESYEREKRKRRVVDYDDLLLAMTNLLETDEAYAASQAWRFRHIFVDEFQDLNPAQFDLTRAWLGQRTDLFVVGDPNQAIYGWNGADASYLNDIERYFPGVEILHLPTNYRSTTNILAAACAVLPGTVNSQGGTELELGPRPTIRSYAGDTEEAHSIAREIRLARARSRRWSDIAVLVRTNAQRGVIERALEEAQIPYRGGGGAAWVYSSEVSDVFEMLKNSPSRRLAEQAPDIEQLAKEATGGRSLHLQEMTLCFRQCIDEDPDISVADFLSFIEVSSRHDGPIGTSDPKAVTVTTFHRAKGLEWPVVFLAGLEDGLVPHGRGGGSVKSASRLDDGGAQGDEEQRLFYVAITRAREELHLSWAQTRTTPRGTSVRFPSPWLALIERASLTNPAPSPDQVHAVIDEGRSLLHLTEPTADPIRDAIEGWRAARAKLTGINPGLILPDSTIDAIVDLRPSNREQLMDVVGIGPVMVAAVGDDLLDLIAANRGSSIP